MGSNNYYAVDVNIGSNDQRSPGSSTSSSSRKGRKNSSSEKPKQPQRGLGVAQLEKIRLHGQMAAGSTAYLQTPYSSASSSSSSSCSYGFQPHPQNFLRGFNEHNSRSSISFGDSQTARWNIASNGIPESHHFAQPSMTRHLFNPQEDTQNKERKELRGDPKNYIQNYKPSDKEEVDLELRL